MENLDQATGQDQTGTSVLSRRQLLKALVAAGGAAAVASLPDAWTPPMIEVGTIPAHAQVSPTPTANPPLGIQTCTIVNPDTGVSLFYPSDTIRTFVTISPPTADVEMSVMIYRNLRDVPHDNPTDLQLLTQGTRETGANGRSGNYEYDMSAASPPISSGTNRLKVVWDFVNPVYQGAYTVWVDILAPSM
jgi:hypothetical protein